MIRYKSQKEREKRELRMHYIWAFVLIILIATILNQCAIHKNTEVIATPMTVELTHADIEDVIPVTDVRHEEHEKLQYGFTEKEIYLLAQLLCGSKNIDGDGEYDFDFMNEIDYGEVGKVLGVIMNRIDSGKFPDNVKDVVLARNQFPNTMPRNITKTPSDKALKIVREWCGAYDHYAPGIQSIPRNHIYFNGNGKTNTTRS